MRVWEPTLTLTEMPAGWSASRAKPLTESPPGTALAEAIAPTGDPPATGGPTATFVHPAAESGPGPGLGKVTQTVWEPAGTPLITAVKPCSGPLPNAASTSGRESVAVTVIERSGSATLTSPVAPGASGSITQPVTVTMPAPPETASTDPYGSKLATSQS